MKLLKLYLFIFLVFYVGSLFSQVNLSSSNLPIVSINTVGQSIVSDTRIHCDLGIINNGEGVRNNITDPFNDYDGKINIEIRGSSSAWFDKKSYSFETQTTDSLNNDVSILSLPAENDWVLYGPYSDKSLLRNYISYYLAAKTGRYSPRTKFCELLINLKYKGIYVLTEKIKRDTNRVDIASLNPEEIQGNDLTGGYILKIDKFTESQGESFKSSYPPFSGAWQEVDIQFHDPKSDELSQMQKFYIKNYISKFEIDLYNADPNDLTMIYNKYIDIGSFIDFLIINEVTKNIDGYRLSTFFYKDKFSNGGGKLNMGPVWDFNFSLGNGNYYEGWETSGWQYDFRYVAEGDGYQLPFWWEKLLLNQKFANKLKTRWLDLRSSFLHTDSILDHIDEQAIYLEEAQDRNFQQWPILGTYVWPNYFIANTYDEEIDFMKNWLIDRMIWIDNNLPGEYSSIESAPEEKKHALAPNPASNFIKLYSLKQANIKIYDSSGRLVLLSENISGDKMIYTDQLNPGIYIIRIEEYKHIENHKLIINRFN